VSRIARSLWGSVVLIVVLMTAACGSGGNSVDKNLTWQEAKAATQKKELEIAAVIPHDLVTKIDQLPKGTLMSCGQTQVYDEDERTYKWTGGTDIFLIPGTPQEPLIRAIEEHYKDSRFTTIVDRRLEGTLRIQLYDEANREAYVIGSGFNGPDSVSITSYSPCFELPEETWSGGTF